MQGAVTLQVGKSAQATRTAEPHRRTVPLRKQYVPVVKNGAVLAYKTSYFGSVHIGGQERQSFRVVFDTGSGHLILPSVSCSSAACTKHRRYNSSASAGAVEIDHAGAPVGGSGQREELTVSFGTGQVRGGFVRDSVCLGPLPGDCFEASMVVAEAMSDEPFALFEFDGVMGLGYSSLSLGPQFSIFGRMVAANPAMKPIFSVFLARHDGGRSAISFGGHDEGLAASEVEWSPVAMPELGHWQVQIKAIRIGGKVLPDCADGTCRAILDTGTSLLGVPKMASRNMQKLLARPVPPEHGAGRAAVDCRTVPGSDVHFELGSGTVITLTAEDYTRPKALNITTPDTREGWDLYCRSLLLPVDMQAPLGPKIFIWGEPVLRNYLTLYDWGERRIGFAKAAPAPLADGAESAAVGAPPLDSLAAGVPLRPRAT